MTRNESGKPALDLDAIRTRLEQAHGPRYWQSLEEVADTEEFRKFVDDEFPSRSPEWLNPVNRRQIMKLMGASFALAGVSACTRQPVETIVPYVRQPEDLIPGKPLFYATTMPLGGVGTGLLIESHMGRPTKAEGNPDHPGSLGATDAFAQASLLGMYDPDRSQVVTRVGSISSWVNFVAVLTGARELAGLKKGAGLRILTETVTSPSLAAQIKGVLADLPQAKWHQYEPLGRHNAHAGSQLAFGQPVNTVYRIENADVIVSLDADFLACGPGNIRYAREFANKRRVTDDKSPMNRLYVVEGTPSVTGASADHRFIVRTGEVPAIAVALAQALGVGSGAPLGPSWVASVAADLQAHKGSSLVVAGEFQPASVHALAHAMNQALGNAGKTVYYTDPLEANPVDQIQSLKSLADDMNAGLVESLVILGGNPIYNAPADFGFKDAMSKVKLRMHLGGYADETALFCHWHVPEAHYLETWSDIRGYDGTLSLVQPLIAPLYGGKTAHDVLGVLEGKADRTNHDVIREYWQGRHPGADFDEFWQTSLHNGLVAGTALPPKAVTVTASFKPAAVEPLQGMEIVFRPDPSVLDGRFSNNGWLQELPKPQSMLTWDNAAMVSPATAQKLGVANGDLVELSYQGRSVTAPVWTLPGQAADSVTVHLGYGRTRSGKIANGVGFDAFGLRTSAQPWSGSGLEVKKNGGHYALATPQPTHAMDGREPVREATLAEFHEHPDFVHIVEKPVPRELSMFPEKAYDGYKWGMSIDLNACTGCHACTIACQAENNIPVVGKEQVIIGRHMHWLRVDRYYEGNLDEPRQVFQPVACVMCENAPCELVCPVAATVHSGDGLNQMVYNRCVGTRYCSNNCPYKVRRFNFYLFSDWYTQSMYGLRNPDVTVRSRGVMEKCTYCVQRINAAKIESEKEDRRIKDGDVITACQQVCPTQAIVFGDMNDPNSRVSKLKAQTRDYTLLEELNTRPRTTYLARLRNPNPELEKKG